MACPAALSDRQHPADHGELIVWIFYELPNLESSVLDSSFYVCAVDGACHPELPWYVSWFTAMFVLQVANRVFKFARRHCRWRGENPLELLERNERPKVSATPERRIYEGDELGQTLAASWEPFTTIFRLAHDVGGRESELLGLWWENVDLRDINRATIRFTHQLYRAGERVEVKTEESKATLPLPRATARMLLEQKARTRAPTGPRSFVFATRYGKPLGQPT